MLYFKVNDGNYFFDLEFKGKFNYLLGNSGTHKTHLIKILQKLKRHVRSVRGYVSLDNENIVMNALHLYTNEDSTDVVALLETMSRCKNDIFIIDECNSVMAYEKIGKVFKESQNYFIILGHAVDGNLPVNVESVFTLKATHKSIVNVPMYQKFNIREIGEVDYILTEDSVSGRLFFEHYFPDIRVCSKTEILDGKKLSRDNSQLHNFLRKDINQYNKILLVYDASAYAAFLPLLYEVLVEIKVMNEILVKRGEIPKKVTILDWDSYESYILSLPIFNMHIVQEDTKCLFNSVEQMCEQLLSKLIGYKKDKLPACIRTDKVCENCKKRCDYRNSLNKQLCIQAPLDTIIPKAINTRISDKITANTINAFIKD